MRKEYRYTNCASYAFTDFDSKVYVECDDVLRAAYLKRVEWKFTSRNEVPSGSYSNVTLVFNTAGRGMYSIASDKTICGEPERIGIHRSVEEYKAKGKSLKYDYLKMQELLPVIFKGIACVSFYSDAFVVFRWKWNGIKPEPVYLNFTKATLTKEGWTTDAIIPEYTYATKAECEEDNQVSVIEFEN